MSRWILLPDEIVKLIFHYMAHPMWIENLTLIRSINKENATKFRLVPRMYHPEKSIKAQAVIEACVHHEFFWRSSGYAMLYTRVYSLCTAKAHMNCSADLYNAAVAFLESKCANREITFAHAKMVVHVCKYIDRFYTRRLTLKSVEEVAAEACKKHGIVPV
jgi:hypothetical protein